MEQEDLNPAKKSSNFDKFVKDAFGSIRDGIKAANGLPSSENFNYYLCYPTFNRIRNKQAKSLVNSMQNIIKLAGVSTDFVQRDVEEKFDLVLEANDVLIDRAESCIDEEAGITRNPQVELIVSQTVPQKKSCAGTALNGSWNKFSYQANNKKISENTAQQAKAIRLLAAKNIHRPQLTFSDKIDNSFKPWKPKLHEKPNSIGPLRLVSDSETGEFLNPYRPELDAFEVPDDQLVKSKPKSYKPLEETPLIKVESKSDLQAMIQDLKKYRELAIDLEHHSYRSFQGITCLIQISTRDTDYLVDALCLRSELHALNEIFTAPQVLKVFHGADSDVEWLQRDFSVYLVNMFDTHQAAKLLNLPFLSLAYLVKTHCGIDPNKHFQLADWRIRPLPEELVRYAREDTHYLLYIKDILRNQLIDKGGQALRSVYHLSREICGRTYVKPIWTEDSYLSIYRKSQKMFNNRQLFALKELHRWRDQVAREEDDSTNYVLPNHMLLNVAETLPREMQGVLACCNPIPPLVRQNLLKIHKVVLKAREQPLVKSIESDLRQRMTQRTQQTEEGNMGSWAFRPHDHSSRMEAANLTCLLDNANNNMTEKKSTNLTHITVFDSSEEDEYKAKSEGQKKKKLVFISPYKRYELVLPFVAEQEKLAKEEEDRQEAIRIKEALKRHAVSEAEKQASMNRVRQHFETITSIDRVHQHFQKMAQFAPDASAQKRKRDSGDSDASSGDDTPKFVPRQDRTTKPYDTSSSISRVHQHFKKMSHLTSLNFSPSTEVGVSKFAPQQAHSNTELDETFSSINRVHQNVSKMTKDTCISMHEDPNCGFEDTNTVLEDDKQIQSSSIDQFLKSVRQKTESETEVKDPEASQKSSSLSDSRLHGHFITLHNIKQQQKSRGENFIKVAPLPPNDLLNQKRKRSNDDGGEFEAGKKKKKKKKDKKQKGNFEKLEPIALAQMKGKKKKKHLKLEKAEVKTENPTS